MSISDPTKEDIGEDSTVSQTDLPTGQVAAVGSESKSGPIEGEGANGDMSAQPSLVDSNVPRKSLCGVCNVTEAKYRCPQCYLP